MPERPKIPRETKHIVRRRCGFACVECGYPIFEYHHWPPYAETRAHDDADLVLLCRNHHGEAGSTLFPPAAVLAAKANPFALRHGASSAYATRFAGNRCAIELGGDNAFFGDLLPGESLSVVEMFGETLLAFSVESETLLLTLRLYDRADTLRLWIEENELAFRSDNYDVEWIRNRVVVRTAPRRVALEITLAPPSQVAVPRAMFWKHGCFIRVTPRGIVNPSRCVISSSRIGGAGKGIVVVDEDFPGFSRDEPRLPFCCFALPRHLRPEFFTWAVDPTDDEDQVDAEPPRGAGDPAVVDQSFSSCPCGSGKSFATCHGAEN